MQTLACILPLVLCSPAESPKRVHQALAAIRHVESRGNDRAVGDGGRAIGAYQIHRAYWKDSGVPGRWRQCANRRYAERVVLAYWRRYCPKALAAGDIETLARIHNGGPMGHQVKATHGYWRKVSKALGSSPKKKATHATAKSPKKKTNSVTSRSSGKITRATSKVTAVSKGSPEAEVRKSQGKSVVVTKGRKTPAARTTANKRNRNARRT